MSNQKCNKSGIMGLLAAFLFLAVSCITGTQIFSHSVPKAELGTRPYTVIVYRSADADFLKTVAFLYPEGGGYEILPFGASFNYSVTSGVRAEEALAKASKAVSFHSAFKNLELRAITVPDGAVAGYEVRPLYLPFVYGDSDVLDVSYVLQPGGKITAFVDLKSRIERRFTGGDHHAWGEN